MFGLKIVAFLYSRWTTAMLHNVTAINCESDKITFSSYFYDDEVVYVPDDISKLEVSIEQEWARRFRDDQPSTGDT